MRQALYYKEIGHQKVQCQLCPHNCRLELDERGICQVRKNINGTLISENFGLCSSIQLDPIEKKPLYHFYPGSHILSIGSIGCNLKCNFCQNYEISQTSLDQYLSGQFYEPLDIIAKAQNYSDNLGLAFTYNEPTVYFEFMLETCKQSQDLSMKNVMVSNGFINQEPLQELLPYIDAFNIDIKAFTESFYKKITKGHLESVKETLMAIKMAGKHLELTNLLIPSKNDDLSDFTKMVAWIGAELGNDTVLHLSRYFPSYKSKIQKTPLGLLYEFFEHAKKYLNYVYLGNITGCESQNTICSGCGKIVISRYGNFIQRNGIDSEGNCTHCNNKILIS